MKRFIARLWGRAGRQAFNELESGRRILAHLKGGGTVRDHRFQEWELVAETETGAFVCNKSVEKGVKGKARTGLTAMFLGFDAEYDPSQPTHCTITEMARFHILKDGIPAKAIGAAL